MSSEEEDGGNYACDGYDCDTCGYDDGKEVVRKINDDVYDEDEEFKLLQASVRNLELQISALVKKVYVLNMKVVELGGTPYDENDYPDDEDDDYDPDQYPDDEDDGYEADECISDCNHEYCNQ